jgi:large subunit ribosomal protein L3
MRQTILGRKLGMTQVFDHQGDAIPVTIVQAGPCTVLQVKTVEKDGYNAIQLGFGDMKEKHTTKPLMGHFTKAESTPKRHIRETRVEDPGMFKIGQVITAGMFEKDDRVDVTGTSKGKGFAGVMKRHGFAGFMATHGVHESKRGPGSVGQSADPAKIFKGMRMPGQMGNETVTVQNLRVVDVREGQNLIMLKGPVPGGKNGLLVIHHAIKKDAPPLRQSEPEETAEETQAEIETPVEETAGEAAVNGGPGAAAASESAPEPGPDEAASPEADDEKKARPEVETAAEAEAEAGSDNEAESGAEAEPDSESGAEAEEASEDSEKDSK